MKQLLADIYQHLRTTFGKRNWWPAETREEIIIGAILAQNVSWENVKKAVRNLKDNELLTLEALHTANDGDIALLIRSTRFYNQKAKKLKNFTKFLFSEYEGSLNALFSQNLKGLRKELLNINGLGEETVDSILLYAGSKVVFVVDAYTRRIFSRLGITENDWSYGKYQQFFMNNLEPSVEVYNDYHAQIVYLGHHFCKANDPECNKCPIKSLCRYYKSSLAR